MTSVLCYGDSNTWGYIPGEGDRYDADIRWPLVMQHHLGPPVRVIEEGLSGRYTVWDDAERAGRNGAALLQPLLESHAPLSLVILMLGTNDVLHRPGLTARDAADGAGTLIHCIAASEAGPGGGPPHVLLVSPPRIGKLSPELAAICHGNPAEAEHFSRHFARVAAERRCHFFDAAEVVEPSPVDGVHLDAEGHARLGEAIAVQVRQLSREA